MSKYIPGNYKHLTAADRLYIERQLNAGTSFKVRPVDPDKINLTPELIK